MGKGVSEQNELWGIYLENYSWYRIKYFLNSDLKHPLDISFDVSYVKFSWLVFILKRVYNEYSRDGAELYR